MASAKQIDFDRLAGLLGHAFADRDLLAEALTHGSALARPGSGQSYQRLEFLGDRVLGLVIAEMLLETFPDNDEGELAPRYNALVRGETCAAVARELGLGEHVMLGASEAASGGREKEAILADICESVIGAIFSDGGFAAARAFVRKHWSPRMQTSGRPRRDPKTRLQEWAQGRGLPLPRYEVVERTGPDHAPEFKVRVELPGVPESFGKGRSIRDGEQAAARAALQAGGIAPDWAERP